MAIARLTKRLRSPCRSLASAVQTSSSKITLTRCDMAYDPDPHYSTHSVYILESRTIDAPTRDLAAERLRHGKARAARVLPAFGLTADEGHLFIQNGAPIRGPWVRAFLERWLQESGDDAGRVPGGSSWPEAGRASRRGAVVVVPVEAAAKEHGPHLPLRTDYLVARGGSTRQIGC